MTDRHPGSGRRLPSALETVATAEDANEQFDPVHLEHVSAAEIPWLVFGPWTIYSMQRPSDASLAALLVSLAELVKLNAAEMEHSLAGQANRRLKAPNGFHELWGQAKSSPDYDKQKWVAYQAKILAAGDANAKAFDDLAACIENGTTLIAKLDARIVSRDQLIAELEKPEVTGPPASEKPAKEGA